MKRRQRNLDEMPLFIWVPKKCKTYDDPIGHNDCECDIHFFDNYDKMEKLIYSDVFDKICKYTQNLYIDMYEEPRLDPKQIKIALPLLEEAMNKKAYSDVAEYIEIIIKYMKLALEQNTFVEIQL